MITASIDPNINVVFTDYPDPSIPVFGVFFRGCDLRCYKCQNPELQCHSKENLMAPEELDRELTARTGKMNLGVALMGGDPFAICNRKFTLEFLRLNKKPVIIYTGYNLLQLEHILEAKEVLREHSFDYLKCGPYIYKQRQKAIMTDDFFQLASDNQCLYNKGLHLLTQKGRYTYVRRSGI